MSLFFDDVEKDEDRSITIVEFTIGRPVLVIVLYRLRRIKVRKFTVF